MGRISVGLCLFMPVLAACATTGTTDYRGNVIADSLASSVQLFVERDGGARRAGSGVVLAVDGDGNALILTAAHLLEPPTEQSVHVVSPRTGDRVEATILAVDADADVAVLEVSGLQVAPVRFKADANLGDNVWVVSFPWGRRGTVVNGVVSQIVDGDDDVPVPIRGPVGLIDAAVSYGTSGGGVFDSRTGMLVGIVRGYRTARLALPGNDTETLDLPIGGETTVIPTARILCFLRSADLTHRVRATAIAASATAAQCAAA
ncbi:MAG: serine protease [Alphaproteobacteria bacterium]